MNNLIDERASDQLYLGTVRFFRALMKSSDKWKVYGPRRYKTYVQMADGVKERYAPGYLARWAGSINDKLYSDYLRISGDNKGDIIPDLATLDNVISAFHVMIFPRNTYRDAQASMDDRGMMNIYFVGWEVPTGAFQRPTGLTAEMINSPLPDVWLQGAPDEAGVRDILRKQNGLASIVSHELTHYINSFRSGGLNYRSAGGDKQFNPNNQEYTDSTEEEQARFIQYINRFDGFISKRELDDLYGDSYSLMYYLAMGNPQQFINGFYQNIIKVETSDTADNLSGPNRKRLLKRISDVYNHYRDIRHPLLIALAQDVVRRNGQPRFPLVQFEPIPQINPYQIKSNTRKKVFVPKTQPRTKPRPEQTIAEMLHIKAPTVAGEQKVNTKNLTRNFLRRYALNEGNVPVDNSDYSTSVQSGQVSNVYEAIQALEKIVQVFPGHEQEIVEMIDALRAMIAADDKNPTGRLGKGRNGLADSPMR